MVTLKGRRVLRELILIAGPADVAHGLYAREVPARTPLSVLVSDLHKRAEVQTAVGHPPRGDGDVRGRNRRTAR